MDSSTPYVELPLSVQHPSVSVNKDRAPENDFQQISSQTLLDFLPSLHNVPKGGLDVPEFHLPSSENMEEELHSSFKVNDGCNLLLNPFSDSQQLEHGLLYGHRSGMQANDTSSHIGNMPHQPSYLNVNTSASQEPQISLSSHIFPKNVESPPAVPSSFPGSMLPFNPSYENGQFNKNFSQLEDINKHIECDNSRLGMKEGTMASKPGQNCSEEGGESVNPVCDTLSLRSNLAIRDPIGHNISNTSGEELNLKDDLEHINLHNLNSEETKVVENVMTCAFCPKSYKTQEQLSKHESLHPYQSSAIQCSKCGEILGNYMLLQEHKQYEDYLSSCDLCGQLFPNEECMICHIRNTHNDVDDIFDEESGAPEELEAALNIPAEVLADTSPKPILNQRSCLEEETGSNANEDLTQTHYEKSPPDGSLQDESNTESTPCFVEEENLVAPSDSLLGSNDASCDQKADDPSCSAELENSVEETACVKDEPVEPEPSKPEKTKCRYCTKKCSTRKSLVRHERSHPYATAAMKCNLCLEVVVNYKAFKVHKKNLGAPASCITCNQVCPNENCLKCHVRNVHNNFVYVAPAVFDVDDSNDEEYEEGEADSDSAALSVQQYSVSKYTVGDSGAPLRITIKQEREEIFSDPASPSYSAPTPPTPATPSPRGAPTPSPPAYVYESEPSEGDDDDGDDDQEYEPYASDQGEVQSKKHSRRKSALRKPRKSTSGSHFLSSSEESDHDESGDFNYSPQTNSESEENSDEDAEWDRTENTYESPKKRTRRRNPLSDDDSDVDPDWGRQSSSVGSKKKGRRKKGPLSDDSENDLDWGVPQKSFVTTKKRSSRKKSSLSEDDSDFDPDWKQDDTPSVSLKKKVSGRKARKKTYQVAFFVPAIPVPKIKRPNARGLGGQKAQDAAAALAEAVEDMETTVPELKTVIKPVRRSVTKASLKKYNENETYEDDYDYILDVKPEPKESPGDSETLGENNQQQSAPTTASYHENEDPYNFDDELNEPSAFSSNKQSVSNAGNKNGDQQEEQIVVKAEPYDFQDNDEDEDDEDPSFGTDLYFSKKFCEPNSQFGNIKSPAEIKADPDAEDKPKKELRYVCKICGRALQYRSHLVRHLRRVHDGEGVEEVMRRLMKCRFCDKPYSNELSLINHEKLHDGTSKMKCNKCEERFDDKNALRRHQRKMHWEHQPVECEICKKQLSDNTCLKAHMKHMHGAEEKKVTVFTCETCGRQLHTKTAFQNHVASKCGTNLLFPCETCGKSFSFKGSLKAHQLLHTGVKSFLCKFCGKAFHQKGEMKRHERKHTGEKPFVCEVCGRAFAYRESLLGHSAVHTGIKPFPCKSCGMRFSCSGNLVKHRRSNNCKGSTEQGDITVVNLDAENTQESTNVKNVPVDKPVSLLPEAVAASGPLIEHPNVLRENSSAPQMNQNFVNESHKIKQEPGLNTIPDLVQQIHPSGVQTSSNMTHAVKLPQGISVKPVSALQSTPKEMKPIPEMDLSQSYQNPSSAGNRSMGHLNPMYDRHENNVGTQNNYNSHSAVNPFSENHFRQTNQVSANDRRYSQFSIDGYAGRPEQYFDHQSLMRHEMNRQVMERAVDRQAPRFLDFGAVRFSGVDSRNAMQSYHSATLPHTSGYSNIHPGHLGSFGAAAAHTAGHSAAPANMYGGNSMMQGPVGFPAFTSNNHMAMGYGHNNPLPAHSVAHASSYPTSHMSHLEALFGHFSQNAASNSLQRLSNQNSGSATLGNPSLPSNHRV